MTTCRSTAATRAVLTALVFAPAAGAVEPINFQVRNNGDLVTVCSTPTTDPDYVAAIHFCHGFAVGFVRYHDALKEGKPFAPLFCFPPSATRSQVVAEYVGYSRAHPAYDTETVGDVMTKFLVDTYPCPAAGKP